MWWQLGNKLYNLNYLVSAQKLGANNFTLVFLSQPALTGLTQAQIKDVIDYLNATGASI